MKRSNLSTLLAIIILSALLAGCQSAARLAWWKPSSPPTDDISLASRTAEPQLPSVQSTPTTVGGGLSEATAATSVASATPQTTAPPLSAASNLPTGSQATLANAPTASYPQTTSPGSYPSIGGAAAATQAAASSAANTANAAGGPYNPANYQPPSTAAATGPASTAFSTGAPGSTDRYGMSLGTSTQAGTTGTAGPAAGDRYASTSTSPMGAAGGPATAASTYGSTATGTPVTGDRYGLTSTPAATAAGAPAVPQGSERAYAAFAAGDASASTASSRDRYGQPSDSQDRYGAAAGNAATPTSDSAASQVVSPIRIVPPAGKFRPAGTMSYADGETQAADVANRPPGVDGGSPSGRTNNTPATPPYPTSAPGSEPGSRYY